MRTLLERWLSKQRMAFLVLLALPGVIALAWNAPALAQTNVNRSSLRVVNGLPGLGAVDVYLDGERLHHNLAPQTATSYWSVISGKHVVAVRPVDADALTAPIADVVVNIAPNESQSAIAYQKEFATKSAESATTLNAPPLAQSGAMFIVHDDRSPTVLGKTRLTAVHLAVGTPGKISVGYPSGASLLDQISLEKSYGTIDIEAGIYPLALLNADSPDQAILERAGDQNFYANTLYTLIIIPNLSAPAKPYQMGEISALPRLFVVSAPLDPPQDNGLRLRIFHAAFSTAVVDVYVDDRLVASRLFYKQYTEYLGLPNYSHTITLRRFGLKPTDPPLAQANFAINKDNRNQVNWTLMLLNGTDVNVAALQLIGQTKPDSTEPQTIINTPGGAMVMTLLPDNIAQTSRGTARIRLVNAADGLPGLRLFTPNLPIPPLPPGAPTATPSPTPDPTKPLAPPRQLIDATIFGAEANEADVPAGIYTELSIIPVGSADKLWLLPNPQLVSGMVYTYVVVGSSTSREIIPFQEYGTGLPIKRLYVGVIRSVSVNLRSEITGINSITVARLPKDTEVEVLGRSANGQFIRVRYTNVAANNLVVEGWIQAVRGIMNVTRLGVAVNFEALPIYVPPTVPGSGS